VTLGICRPESRWTNSGDPVKWEANWLLCATVAATQTRTLMFHSDPIGAMALFVTKTLAILGELKHVYVSQHSTGPYAKTPIHEAIMHKQGNGAAYCGGKTLVVLLDTHEAGTWFPEVAKTLPSPLWFAAVWVVCFSTVQDSGYVYNLTLLDVMDGNVPAASLRIAPDFDPWRAEVIQ
jgi:hypothetical protein